MQFLTHYLLPVKCARQDAIELVVSTDMWPANSAALTFIPAIAISDDARCGNVYAKCQSKIGTSSDSDLFT